MARSIAARADLVRHALASEQFSRAFQLGLSAGDEALRLFAVRSAIVHFERALALLSSLSADHWQDALSVGDQLHLFLRLGDAYQLVATGRTRKRITNPHLRLRVVRIY